MKRVGTELLDELRARIFLFVGVRRPGVPRLHRRRLVCTVAAATSTWPCSGMVVFGNPHSVNPTSTVMTELVARARARESAELLQRASPEEYGAYLHRKRDRRAATSSANPIRSDPSDRFLLTVDNHNSVNGIREFALVRGAETTLRPGRCAAICASKNRSWCYREIATARDKAASRPQPVRLSRRNPTSRACSTHSSGSSLLTKHGWDVLAGRGSLQSRSNRLDLSARAIPTSSVLSFYKMFG